MLKAIFRIKSTEEILPKWARGRGISAQKIRFRDKLEDSNGEIVDCEIPVAGSETTFEVLDSQQISQFKADPRFVLISETV